MSAAEGLRVKGAEVGEWIAWKEESDKWGWTKIADHEYDTPCGLIDLTRDGKATLDTVMQDEWVEAVAHDVAINALPGRHRTGAWGYSWGATR